MSDDIVRIEHLKKILHSPYDIPSFRRNRNKRNTFSRELYKDISQKTKMLPKLKEFYLECVLPEIVDPRETRNMRVRDPPHIQEAQRSKAENDARKTKKN